MDNDGHRTHEESASPLLSRALHLHVQPASRLTWAGAGWAALCGIVAAGVPQFSVDVVVRVLLTLVLADSVLGTVWKDLIDIGRPARTDEAKSMLHRSESRGDGRVSSEPRTVQLVSPHDTQVAQKRQPAVDDLEIETAPASFWASMGAGVDGVRPETWGGARTVLGVLRQWRRALTVTYRQQVVRLVLLTGLAILLALILGQGVAVIVGLGLLLPLVVWFAAGGYPLRHHWARAVLEIGLSWAVGLAAFSTFPAAELDGLSGLVLSTTRWAGGHGVALGVGLLFVVAYYGKLSQGKRRAATRPRALVNLSQVVIVPLLVVWQRPILASTAAVLVLGEVLFQRHLSQNHARWYLRATQWFFMGVMLAAAIGLASR